jgi:hypothetical protein
MTWWRLHTAHEIPQGITKKFWGSFYSLYLVSTTCPFSICFSALSQDLMTNNPNTAVWRRQGTNHQDMGANHQVSAYKYGKQGN